MKVKDLMKELENLDPEATVLVPSDNFEVGHVNLAPSFVSQHETGKKSIKNCVDAFDYTSYGITVWSTVGGSEKVVTIK